MATYRTREEVEAAVASGTITMSEGFRIAENLGKASSNGSGGKLSCKIGPKGTVCVSGLNSRMPVTLYYEQWLRLVPFLPEVLAFAASHVGNPYKGKTKVDGKEVQYSMQTAIKSDDATVRDLLAKAEAAFASN